MASEIQKMSIKEINEELAVKREELRKFRFDVTGTKITNNKEGQNLRREIAQLLTELGSRKEAS